MKPLNPSCLWPWIMHLHYSLQIIEQLTSNHLLHALCFNYYNSGGHIVIPVWYNVTHNICYKVTIIIMCIRISSVDRHSDSSTSLAFSSIVDHHVLFILLCTKYIMRLCLYSARVQYKNLCTWSTFFYSAFDISVHSVK